MVYRGRPSTGCKKCRERKVKCDERPQGCTKCMSSGFPCPGYDRTNDSLFHDETARVVIKAKKSKAKAIAARDARDRASSSQSDEDQSVVIRSDRNQSPSEMSNAALQYSIFTLIAPLVDQGLNYFMSRYTLGMDEPSVQSPGYHSHLSTNGFHPLVATSITALGLAGVANIHGDAALKRKATSWYLDAIKMTNKAISSPTEVKSDTTLFAIMLLGMFEAMFNEYTFMEWSKHVNGAAALIKLRGTQQLATSAGRRMYLHSIGLLALNCLGAGDPMPPYVEELNQEIIQYMDTSDPRERWFFLHNSIINLRAEILNNKDMPLQDIIKRALDLDEIATGMFIAASSEWTYQHVQCEEDSPFVFGNTYHVYPSLSTAQTHNWWRYSRIYLHDIIRNAILAGLSESPLRLNEFTAAMQLSTSNAILKEMQDGILASMPQFLHDVPSVPSRTGTPISPSPSPIRHKNISDNFVEETIPFRRPVVDEPAPHRLPIVRVSGGHSTLWAVYIAGSMPTATEAAQQFAVKSLRRFKNEFGINQGNVLALSLEEMRKQGRRNDGICPAYLPD